jgi:SEC-C motif-containing protein
MEPLEASFLTREALGASYEDECDLAGLEPTDQGWGLLHCIDEDGQRWTRVSDDVEYLRTLVAGREAGELSDLVISPDKFPLSMPGWPIEWAGILSRKQTAPKGPCPCGSGKMYKDCHGADR